MTKLIITIPKQSFEVEGRNRDEAINKFFSDEIANLDWYDEQLCDICNQSEDADGRCGCTNEDAHGI